MRPSTIACLALACCVSSGCRSDEVLSGVCTPGASPQFSDNWQQLSDQQLQIEIQRACGQVSIGFKEAGAVRGVDPQGRVLTSAETVIEMKQFLLARGFVFTWQASTIPAVAGQLTVRRGLVTEIRRHAKIDYLEPNFPGSFAARK